MEGAVGQFFFDDGMNFNEILAMGEFLAEPLNVVDNNVRERRVIPKNELYYEETIPRYDDISFREHFRMSRAAFEVLVEHINQQRPNLARNAMIPLAKKVLFLIWIISKQESFLACGDRFGMARSSAYYVFREILSVIVEMLPQYISWPNHHNTAVEVFLERSHGFPGVIGAIDGCHIKIKQPKNNAHDYYNRNSYHSIILQGIADHTLKFIDIFVGLPGRMHDARVFRNSEVYQRITNHENPLLLEDLHILGDSAYPLMLNLLTPFRDNGHLHHREANYNTKLSSIRSVIERAFGRLKGKFRRLKDLDVCEPETGAQIIAAACVLHNFIIIEDNDDEEYEYIGEDPQEEDDENHLRENRQLATIKRNEIVNIL